MSSIELVHRDHSQFFYYIEKNHKDVYDSISKFKIHVDSNDKSTLVPWTGSEFVVVYEGKSYTITIRQEGEPQYDGSSLSYYTVITVSGSHWKDLECFIKYALTYKDTSDITLIDIYNSNSRGYWCRSEKIYVQDLEHIFIPTEIKDNIILTIDTFIASKERYQKFGRAHKLCYLLTGVPGSGKSSLIKAIAKKYVRPLYVVSFSKSLDDENLIELIANVKNGGIIVLEDIDAFFIDREPKDINVSFSAFINVLDGATSPANNTLIFMTANNPERMDPALLRPGRVDKIIKFEAPRKKEVRDAFMAMTTEPDVSKFTEFYKYVANANVCAAAIVDFLFRHPDDYLDHAEELAEHSKLLAEIANSKNDTMYK